MTGTAGSPGSAEQLQRRWNDTAAPYPAASSIPAEFRARARERPADLALVDGARRTSYAQLDAASDRLAARLVRAGVGTESVVAAALPRSDTLVVALLGILKAGGAYLVLDAGEPRARRDRMLADSGAVAIVAGAGQGFAPGSDAPGSPVPSLRAALPVIPLAEHWADELAELAEPPAPTVGPRSLAYLTYTSGSTGEPKGVLTEQRGVLRLVFGDCASLGPGRVLLHASAPAFDAATFEIWGSLLRGGTCAVHRDSATALDSLGHTMRTAGVDTAWLTSSLFNTVIDARPEVLTGLEQLLVGGEALSASHVRRALDRLPSTTLINGYGPTETTTFACCHRFDAPPELDRPVPIGRPIANTTAWVCRPDGQLAEVGEPGELLVGGPGVARGYLGRPELTAERFRPDPFNDDPSARLYATGDSCRWLPEGVLEFLGRRDGQLKIRGHRVEPAEIEAALRELPAVRDVAVVAREDGRAGRQLVAYVVPQPGGDAGPQELRSALLELLPERLVPAMFVSLDRLPLTANGKLDRDALPAPGASRLAAAADRSPGSAAEQLLREAIAEVLGLDQVGADEDFFDLGGDSLLSAAVLALIADRTGIELDTRALFDHRNAAALAPQLAAAQRAPARLAGTAAPRRDSAPRIPRGPAGDRTPLSRAQQGIVDAVTADPASASAYALCTEVRLTAPVDAGALREAFDVVQERQQSLRTVLEPGEVWTARVLPAGTSPVPFQTVDLAAADGPERERALRGLRAADLADPPPLTGAPPVRAQLVRFAAGPPALRVAVHHALFDGWSVGLLLSELSAAYAGLRGEPGVPAPELPVQYADYVRWQQDWPTAPVAAHELDWWRRTLAGLAPLDVPADRPRPATPSGRGGLVEVGAPADTGQALRALASEHGATLFMAAAAALLVLLRGWTGRDDLALSTPVAGRPRPELDALIGCFYNSVLLRVNLAGDPPFGEVLARVRESTLAATDHQHLAFRDVMTGVGLERPDGVKLGVQDRRSLGLHRPFASWLDADSVRVDSGAQTRRDLHLHLWATGGPLRLVLRHSADRFRTETAERALGQYLEVIRRVLQDPLQRASGLVRELELP